MTKQEVIKQAYYGHESSLIDENGWATYAVDEGGEFGIEPCGDYETRNHVDGVYEWRPKSLKGLETNNGWIKIESEKDLPKSGYYEVVLRSSSEITRASILTHAKPKAMVAYISHYQPIKEIEKPLY